MEPILSQLASTVSTAEDLEGLTRPLLELLSLVTGLESTYLTTIDEPRGIQHILFARNARQMQIPEGLSVPWDDTLCKRALEENRPFTDNVAECWGDSDAARALGIHTYMSQPVRLLDGGIYGTLCAASADAAPVGGDSTKVLGLFAALIAHQVERERLVDSLRKSNHELSSHALSDPLTGIGNRRALMLELRRMLDRARRECQPFQIAFIDLDGFKAINDRHGHEIGDRFLVEFAARLGKSVRAGDFIARIGGDEFVVLVTDADPAELRQRLEQQTAGRYNCQEIVIDYPGASVGVITAQPDDNDVEKLLADADAAMYAKKKARQTSRH